MMLRLEKEITVLVCKMEIVFLPGWFNAIQHLIVHFIKMMISIKKKLKLNRILRYLT
jgi:hypothetical protein